MFGLFVLIGIVVIGVGCILIIILNSLIPSKEERIRNRFFKKIDKLNKSVHEKEHQLINSVLTAEERKKIQKDIFLEKSNLTLYLNQLFITTTLLEIKRRSVYSRVRIKYPNIDDFMTDQTKIMQTMENQRLFMEQQREFMMNNNMMFNQMFYDNQLASMDQMNQQMQMDINHMNDMNNMDFMNNMF